LFIFSLRPWLASGLLDEVRGGAAGADDRRSVLEFWSAARVALVGMREFTGALESDETEAPWPLDLREGGRLDDGGVEALCWALWISRLGGDCGCVYWRLEGDGREEDDNAVGW
jgi:hypothetical protein